MVITCVCEGLKQRDGRRKGRCTLDERTKTKVWKVPFIEQAYRCKYRYGVDRDEPHVDTSVGSTAEYLSYSEASS